MQYCSGGPYGVSEMQQLVLAAASHHMFSDGPPHHHHHQQQQLHHQHQQYQQGLQPQDLVEFYHRQAASLQEQEMQGSHILFGLHHHQQLHQKTPSSLDASSLHLPLSHHVSLCSESASLVPTPSKAPSTIIAHDVVSHYKAVAVEDLADLGAAADDADKASLGGSRWPREETHALLRIRSGMDALFRDSAMKGPLWDEVSRKLHEAGFERSAKKCKEKFENVHKYYKKTKDGKSERQDGKTYRFHTELDAIYAGSQDHDVAGEISAMTVGGDGAMTFSNMGASLGLQQLEENKAMEPQETSVGPYSPSSISCGDAVEQQTCGRKRKRSSSWRTMRAFFEDLATQLMERQDALHKKFLEAIEKREDERARREEVYKRQEMARMSREQDLRAREQVLAATRDAALVAFLQKVTGETLNLPEMPTQSMSADAAAVPATAGEVASTPSGEDPSDCVREGGVDGNSRRWPKVEVLALIRVRTSLEPRFQEAGPKAQLWEEVSSSMASLGFNRSAKRCKEKWENINKYYRKTKDNVGRKLRPESATKTCPYFHQLELLYERGILASPNSNKSTCKLDGSQTSGELLESSSRDESQQTHEGSGNPDYPPGSSFSNVPTPANLQTTIDARGIVVDMPRFSTTTCSSNGTAAPLHNCAHVHDMDTLGNTDKDDSGCLLGAADQINVNCHPSYHFTASDGSHEGQPQHIVERMSCNASPGMLGVSPGSHFMREMMEIQQQSLDYERHQMGAHRDEHGEEMQNAGEVEMRMQQDEDQRSRAINHGRAAHHDSATLMAFVHKLASSGDGDPSASEFDPSSPASSTGQQV